MSVTLRLIILTLRFITKLARKNVASPYLFYFHTFIENVKPFCKVFCFCDYYIKRGKKRFLRQKRKRLRD